MALIRDNQGREREAINAAQTLDVPDPIHGYSRRLFAGQPVPADLEEAYKMKMKKGKTKASAPGRKVAADG